MPNMKRQRFFMDPHDECTVPKCPNCGTWTERKRFVFVIKRRSEKLRLWDSDCKYCSDCHLIIAAKRNFMAFEIGIRDGQRRTLGDEYFPIGTLGRKDYDACLSREASDKETLKKVSLFEEIMDFDLPKLTTEDDDSPLGVAAKSKPNSDDHEGKIYLLRVECPSVAEDCIRVIEIPENYSLYHLHDAIQDAVGFGKDHLFEFYAGRAERNRKIVFSEAYEWEERHLDYLGIRLSEVWPLKRLNLYYLFDFGDNWLFRIQKGRKVKEPEKGIEYPRVIERIGENPEQYPTWSEQDE